MAKKEATACAMALLGSDGLIKILFGVEFYLFDEITPIDIYQLTLQSDLSGYLISFNSCFKNFRALTTL